MISELVKVTKSASSKAVLNLQFARQAVPRDMSGATELRFKPLDRFEIEDLGSEGFIIRIKSNENKPKRSIMTILRGYW